MNARYTQFELRFIDSKTTEDRTGTSRWTLWRWEEEGKFPRSIKLKNKRVWIESEVLAWMQKRIAER
jgi:predicted DNA-binding transcriptional regulator AlpA